MLNPNFIQFLHSMILGWEHRCSMRPGTGSTRRPIGSERSVPTGTTSQWVSDSWSSVKKNALVATGNMGSRITMDNPNTSTLSPHLSLSLESSIFRVNVAILRKPYAWQWRLGKVPDSIGFGLHTWLQLDRSMWLVKQGYGKHSGLKPQAATATIVIKLAFFWAWPSKIIAQPGIWSLCGTWSFWSHTRQTPSSGLIRHEAPSS